MGRLLLIGRLAIRDLRHQPANAVLLLIAITAATTTLTLGLALRGTSSHPYDTTRSATAGPDIVAQAGSVPPGSSSQYPHGLPVDMAGLRALAGAPGVSGHSGPYPYTFVTMKAGGGAFSAMVEGRDTTPAAVDQPELTQGSWIRPGDVVVERAFADAAGIHVGEPVTLNGRPFRVAGIAVTAAIPQYPTVCSFGCQFGPGMPDTLPGLIWVTRVAASNLATSVPLSYLLNVTLGDPAAAETFASAYNRSHPALNAPYLAAWQDISSADGRLIQNEQRVLMTGSWLLGLLAVASVAVLVGGRMAEQTRRVGLLKAVGSTPGLVAAVLLAEHLAVALIAAAAGLLAGWLTAPLLTSPGAGLLGEAGSLPVTGSTAGLVVAMALAVAVVATLVPAVRAARTSTVAALNDKPRPPRRRPALIAVSARLPVPLLLGLRLVARRPRRVLLNVASIAITATGIVAVMMVHAWFNHSFAASTLDNPQTDRTDQVMLVLTVALAALSAVNAILITWATVLDSRHSSALARALGATPEQVSAGLSVAQVLPAMAGALLGIPGGIGLYDAVKNNGGPSVLPPAWWLIAMVAGVVAAVAAITFAPARVGMRHPAAEILQSEMA